MTRRRPGLLGPVVVAVAALGAACGQSSGTDAAASLAPDARRGQELAKSNGCVNCHSTDGTARVGPTWKDLWGRSVTLVDGTTVVADDAYIAESIRSPQAQRVKGFTAAMPALSLDDADVDALVAYIRSLSTDANGGG